VITDPVAVTVVLAGVVYLSLRLEARFAKFRALGAALVGILLAMVLSNVGLLPGSSPAYEFLMGPGVSVGIALILMSVDVRSVARAGLPMLAAFGIGAVGTALGATLGALALSGLVGPETWKLAGQFTGTYTGGGLNFAALGRALGTSADMFSAAVAADVLVTAIWLMACLAVPALLGRPGQEAQQDTIASPNDGTKPLTLERALYSSGRAMPLADLALIVVVAIGAVWAAGTVASRLTFLPEILWLTTFALLAAQLPVVRATTGAAVLGNFLLMLFLASNGANSVVKRIFEVGPAVFYFAAATVAVHGLVIFGLGRLMRLDLGTLAVASQANVGGAASAMALATARGYAEKVLPGVAVGLLGYAVGNYLGFAIATVLRGVIGG
jgi:uncharacterized membrane protein